MYPGKKAPLKNPNGDTVAGLLKSGVDQSSAEGYPYLQFRSPGPIKPSAIALAGARSFVTPSDKPGGSGAPSQVNDQKPATAVRELVPKD